jgi:hypothetical protein
MAYQIDYEITSQKLGIKAENRKRGDLRGDFATPRWFKSHPRLFGINPQTSVGNSEYYL